MDNLRKTNIDAQFEQQILVFLKKTNNFDQIHWRTLGKLILCDNLNTNHKNT